MGSMTMRPSLFLIIVLVIMGCSCDQKSRFAEARPLSFLPQESYSKMFEKLGMVCNCCDDQGGNCKSSWDGSCSNLQCLPWKLH